MSFFVSLSKANADNARLTAELAKITSERDTLTATIAERDAAAESCRAQFDATLSDLTAKLSAVNAELAKVQAATADFDAKVNAEAEKRATAKTDAIMAKIGQPPIAHAAPLAPASTKAPNNLTGLARVAAAFKNQNQK